MGNRGAASGRSRAGKTSQHARESRVSQLRSPSTRALRDWSVSWRLISVIVLALVMGLVFGGLRVSAATGSAAQFGRVAQLANLGQQVTGLVQALEDERDETTGLLPITSPKDLQRWYDATNAAAARVRVQAAGIDGSFPANIQSRVATVVSVITNLSALRGTAQASQSALAVIADYSDPISNMIALNDQIAQGTSDSGLANDVQALNSLSLAKDQAAQQRALLFNALNQQIFADGVQQALATAQSQELTELTAFDTTATVREQNAYQNTVAGSQVNQAQNIEIYIAGTGSLAIGAGALGISPTAAPGQWYSVQSATVDDMQQVELSVAKKIVARAQSLQGGAERSALTTAVLTGLILLLVLIATLAVARSLVRPLRRLREGALDIATVQLPERVRQLSEAQDPSASLEIAPIDVKSADEIGQVARAFDQVHSEAVRLAGNEAMLRRSFNAMFVNLSRRSQSLIERLVRLIDSLEQNEQDPGRLASLFSMDHLVTRMRRNSENLLLLAGHDTARKWSGPVPLADVARAAASEIEQYARVALRIQPGVAISGGAVSDVVHLLAELIENATVFSPEDTPVHVSAQELTTGGVLVEVSDSGVGVPDARLAEMNWRLDHPPVIDVSVSRHMGLFAVARLAERHGVRVRLRPRSPQGLTALVWLPDSIADRGTQLSSWPGDRMDRQTATAARHATGGRRSTAARPAPAGLASASLAPNGLPASGRLETVMPAQPHAVPAQPRAVQAGTGAHQGPQPGTGPRETVRSAGSSASLWFRSQTSSTAANDDGEPAMAPQPATDGGLLNGGLPGSGSLPASSGLPASGGFLAAGGLSGPDLWADGQHAAQVIAEPIRGDQTAAGLPVRVPRANLLPGSAGGGRSPGRGGAGRQAGGGVTQAPAVAQRSPELARNRLSGFQGGIRRAKGDAPGTGEENGR
jgi:signal transduction histidine kinase